MYLYLFIPIISVFSLFEKPIFLSSDDAEGTFIIEGKYLDQNIFLQNSVCNSGVGFCAYEVRVNGNLITDNIQTSAFEIDFNNMEIQKGEKVFIEVKHKRECAIKLINPDALIPEPTFELVDLMISEEGMLKWSTLNETNSLPFIIQQYRWNKWQNVGEVNGIGNTELSNYSFKVDFNSGNNKFRVVQKSKNGKLILSEEIYFNHSIPRLNFIYNKSNKQIVFTSATKFEIHDKYGVLMKRGYKDVVDVSNLIKDDYWLSYDNITEKFKRK